MAVKLLHPFRDHLDWRRRRFSDEVAALRKLRHSGIVRIKHAGKVAGDRPYLVMEFVDGVTLRDLMADGPLEPSGVADLLVQMGEALAAAHRAGVLHRDLKPENVMVVNADTPHRQIKLIDFGIANTEVDGIKTQTTQLAGSPGYVAPERWSGRESYASDIFSLAAVAAEMLTGSPTPDFPLAAVSAPTRQMGCGLSPLRSELMDLLTAGLAYEPNKRPRDPAAFTRELSSYLLRKNLE